MWHYSSWYLYQPVVSRTQRVNKALLTGSRSTPQNPVKMPQIGCKNSTLRFQFLLTDGSTTHVGCLWCVTSTWYWGVNNDQIDTVPKRQHTCWVLWASTGFWDRRDRIDRQAAKKMRQEVSGSVDVGGFLRAANAPLLLLTVSFSPSCPLLHWSPKPKRN